MPNTSVKANNLDFKHIGWKSYNNILKKAVEQEFSGKAGGLMISLSIAFFIVIISAFALSFLYQTIEATNNHNRLFDQKIYYLETINYLPQLHNNYIEKNHLRINKQATFNKLLYTEPMLATIEARQPMA